MEAERSWLSWTSKGCMITYVIGDKLRDHILNLIAGGETPESLSSKTPLPLDVIVDVVQKNMESRSRRVVDLDAASAK